MLTGWTWKHSDIDQRFLFCGPSFLYVRCVHMCVCGVQGPPTPAQAFQAHPPSPSQGSGDF
jgi:hypothetical protein